MKKTLNIDDALLASAKKAAGTSTDTETVQLGLEALSFVTRRTRM
jgi:Arc/MetJ family transcription regulator